MRNKEIAVIMGGISSEREISLLSGKSVASGLKDLGYRTREIVLDDDRQGVIAQLLSALDPAPDCIFNALHGAFGEDGKIQSIFEFLRIPYTHSGVVASGLAFDKLMSYKLFSSSQILCPRTKQVSLSDVRSESNLYPRPFVIKPREDGSSVGVRIVLEDDDTDCLRDYDYPSCLLAQSYIRGREVTVGVLEGKALAAIEISPKGLFYDYEEKYSADGAEHIIPARLSRDEHMKVMLLAERSYSLLGCKGAARADFCYDGKDFYLLEINTQPGLTSYSLLPEMARYVGISFTELLRFMVEKNYAKDMD